MRIPTIKSKEMPGQAGHDRMGTPTRAQVAKRGLRELFLDILGQGLGEIDDGDGGEAAEGF